MKRMIVTVIVTAWASSAAAAVLPERGFVSSQPAVKWEQALISGNGTMGALVFGQPVDETIVLNHARLFMPLHEPLPPVDTASHLREIRQMLADGQYQRAADFVVELSQQENYGGKRWTDPFIPACDVKVKLPAAGTVQNYRRSVDFQTGVATVQWTDERGEFRRRLFVSRPDNVVVLSIAGPGECEVKLTQRPTKGVGGWNPAGMFKDGIKDVAIAGDGEWLTYRSTFSKSWPGSLPGYTVTARVVRRPGEVLVLARVSLGLEDAKAELAGLPTDFDVLLARHAKVHGEMFTRCRLDLGGGADRALTSEELIAKSRVGALVPALLEKEFDAARYAVISSSGELFPNLQGIWTGTWGAPWSGDFTMNGNVQSAIAADLSANMAECLLPYFRYLESQLPQYRENAKRLYGCRGIHVPSRASSHGWNNHFDGTWPMTFWTAGAGWAAQFYYDYYLYTGDREFLEKRALPFMREAAAFYEDFLVTGPDGKLMFSPSYSPENNPGNSKSQACLNATMDIAVARELFRNLSACDDNPRWRAMLAKLPDYMLNLDGAVKEWATPLLDDNYAHRHCSHLYALYNGLPDEIVTNAPLRKAFQIAAEKRMEIRRKENGGIMAFGLVQLGQAASSLRDAGMAYEVVDWLANNYWNNNLVSTHNPKAIFNTDICGGLPAIILKMLVDSQPGWVEVLPALPSQWPTGTIAGVRCRGQIEVCKLTWSPEKISVTLKSDVTQKIELRAAGSRQAVELPRGREVTVEIAMLRNPVWTSKDNLRDPSVLKVADGYRLFYSRLAGDWGKPSSWTIGSAFTKDFVRYEDQHDVSPTGFASPGDVVQWHGRYLLPYQSYPARPTLLCVSESADLRAWSAPRTILAEAARLPWNDARRVIDPTFVVDGDTLHCFFIGTTRKPSQANLLGHAITRDPKLAKWEILTLDAPLLGRSERAPDGVENVMVFKTGDHWTMIYSEGLAAQHLALATSRDLLTWNLEGPLDIPRQGWMARKYGAPFVWRDGAGWRMILMGENKEGRTTFGLLTSPDGKQWNLLPE